MLYILLFVTSLGSTQLDTFSSQKECREVARFYNGSSFRDEIFVCVPRERLSAKGSKTS